MNRALHSIKKRKPMTAELGPQSLQHFVAFRLSRNLNTKRPLSQKFSAAGIRLAASDT